MILIKKFDKKVHNHKSNLASFKIYQSYLDLDVHSCICLREMMNHMNKKIYTHLGSNTEENLGLEVFLPDIR